MERTELNKLNQQIEDLREEMHRSCNTRQQSMNNTKTYQLSRKLDRLILKIMKSGNGK